MFLNLLKKHSISLAIYLIILVLIYLYGMKIWLSYVNLFLFFVIFLLIHENYKLSILNKSIIGVFKYFYLYLSIICIIPIATHIIDNNVLAVTTYVYSEMGLSIFILFLSLYLFLISLKSHSNKSSQLLIISFSISPV